MISRLVSYALPLACLALLLGLAFVFVDPLQWHIRNRDLQRQKDVNEIAQIVYKYAQKTGSLPRLDILPQQIGTQDTGCKLQTKYCQITLDRCANIHFLMGKRDLSLPSDLQLGSYHKTGYAISYDDRQEQLTVTACGAETKQISTQTSLHGLLKTEPLHVKK